jgi:hypothetical protein
MRTQAKDYKTLIKIIIVIEDLRHNQTNHGTRMDEENDKKEINLLKFKMKGKQV